MTGRRASLVLAVLIGLAACSDGGSTEADTTTTALATVPAVTATTTSTTAAGSTTTASLAPGQTATSVAGAATTAAARVVSNPSASVRLGDSGSGVRQIQTALVAQGYKVAVDGSFGPQTSQAVKDFQTKSGITVDGIVGPVTWAKLQAAPAATTTTVKS